MKYYKNNDTDIYYKVYDNNSWQWFDMPKGNSNIIIQWSNGGINFFSRSQDNDWNVEEISEIQLKAIIFTKAL